ncbi:MULTISPECIES: acyl carrier protein [unclassified Polaromonas]|jgi:acyl carrier protein|uniref:acyl carrier protein n=1 Tax=unclassified Polaromonas TaxID=2638319 RepID=UPI0018CAC044|nr:MULTISPECIES: acyl carrier protein [unclassified Polaromonas]MBG6070304.1 acyl carrier protein [Polaromonas sp. CG_9.7]MBG6112302.1 acyl carrier protein [Polaromonas sp. CG_9.2]MDH6183948.1 acyl carrier protein [Polaromonas sp. CG_23.6]
MTETEILHTLNQVFRDVFDNDDIALTTKTTAEDIEGWDSQAHVNLIVAAEVRFGIRFRTAELESLHDVGQFAQLIQTKLAGR